MKRGTVGGFRLIDCDACPLSIKRTRVVRGEGDKKAKIVFVGEAPGREEDVSGRPFVGRAGKEFDRLLDGAGIEREQVYITNVVKCRPPGNRKPRRGEVKECITTLKDEISEVNPNLVVLLGSTAVEAFLKDIKVSKDHGTFVGHFFVSYHPSMTFYGKKEVMAGDFEKLAMVDRALKADRKLILLDYDGTLVPITKNPEDAVLKENGKRILGNLADEVAIVTGRSISSVRKILDIDIPLVANHGFEFYRVEQPEKLERFEKYKGSAEKIYEHFRSMKTKGSVVENKTFGVALHYRNADEGEFFEEFEELLKSTELDNMRIEYGKKVVEFRPDEDWDKGRVVQYLMEHLGGLPIYIGDDNSDEKAFEAIDDRGITISVGKLETKAQYGFRDEKEVLSFLSILGGENEDIP